MSSTLSAGPEDSAGSAGPGDQMRAHESTQKGVDEKWREVLSSFNTLRATWMPAKKLVESLLIQRPHSLDPLETRRLKEVS